MLEKLGLYKAEKEPSRYDLAVAAVKEATKRRDAIRRELDMCDEDMFDYLNEELTFAETELNIAIKRAKRMRLVKID